MQKIGFLFNGLSLIRLLKRKTHIYEQISISWFKSTKLSGNDAIDKETRKNVIHSNSQTQWNCLRLYFRFVQHFSLSYVTNAKSF